MGSGMSADPRKEPAYLAWVSRFPCAACSMRPVHVHHVRRHGERRDDRRVVPLCWSHHLWESPVGIHRLGRQAFQARFGVNLEALIDALRSMWQVVQNRKAA
jgi:hypothetical protein